MDRLEAMSLFVTAVESGSLSSAGRRFGMPLSTVSRKISDLETHIKTRLLHRSTRKLTLTDAGQAYLAACRHILDAVNEAESGAAGEFAAPCGQLTVTAPIVFGRLHVLPVVADFLAAFPDIDVDLRLADRSYDLLDEHIDLALRIGELPDSSMIATRVGAIKRVTCAAPRYLARNGTPKKPEDLAHHTCVTFAGLSASDEWHFAVNKKIDMVAVNTRLTVNTAEAAVDAAAAGIGITRVLCYQAQPAVDARQVKLILRKFEPPPIPVSLIYAGQRRVPQKLRAFLDFAAPRLRVRLGAT